MKKIVRRFCIALLMTVSTYVASAQEAAHSKLICERDLIDANALPVNVTFDHSEVVKRSNGKLEHLYWMRISNNTKCEIKVKTPDDTPHSGVTFARDETGSLIRNPRGGFLLREGYQKNYIPNGSNARVIFYLYNSKKKSVGQGNTDECLVYSTVIYPNQSAVFPVNQWRFKKGHYFEVPFQYVGESQPANEYPLEARAKFAFNDLPAAAFSTKAESK